MKKRRKGNAFRRFFGYMGEDDEKHRMGVWFLNGLRKSEADQNGFIDPIHRSRRKLADPFF